MSKEISEGMKRHWKAKKDSSPDLLWQELVAAKNAHIADLQKEVKRLENLVQVLSDDKFFKPQVVERATPEVETEMVFPTSDFSFQTVEDEPLPTEIDQQELEASLTALEKDYSAHRNGTR